MSEATETAQRFLERTVADLRTLADVYAERAVIEMPFAAPLFPERREVTREELRAGFSRTGGARYTRVSGVRIHETADPATAVIEYRLHGVTAHDGREFALDYVMVITTENGLIVHSRDYSSVVQAAQALGMTERLVAAMTGAD
ncbi:nuclear transport factor 2 family protein [Leifsonia poae]|uniref:nuclear transport factor 2 family protein n=1 Tax=Leifsonia poae TaxID=110933 RepID=UPI001CC17FBD|nr:nuclear transport factor 2 family protein [Leifsonia poae]